MYTTFDRKPQFCLRDFIIEKIIRIPEKEFASMLGNPMEDKDFLMENKELMYQDFSGIYHCLLVMGEGRTDGILVESDGYDYARYASYVPEAAAISYPSLYEMNRKLAAAVDFIVSKGLWNTAEETRHLKFEELESQVGIPISGNPFLRDLLGKMLGERLEVSVMGMDAESGGSRTQYFIGSFDGNTFLPDQIESAPLWLDEGFENYAGVTFDHTDSKILIGWANNWRYAADCPTNEFCSNMTLARELSL